MAVIRLVALNMLNQAKRSISLKKRAGWNQEYLARVIAGTA
jgi:hypothetical protein